MNSAPKKPDIMTSVHSVRVQKFAFFFSYSACFSAAVVGFCFAKCQLHTEFSGLHQVKSKAKVGIQQE